MPKRNTPNNKKFILAVFLFLAIFFFGFGIWIKNYTTNLVNEIQNKEAREARLVNEIKSLNNEINRIENTEKVKRIARNKLNMHTPEPETLSIIINEDILK